MLFSDLAQAPEICALYALDVPPSTLRAKFRTQFEKNKTVSDIAVLDLMLLKAQQEYQETMNGWKTLPHIMKWFAEEEVSIATHRMGPAIMDGFRRWPEAVLRCKQADSKAVTETDLSITLGLFLDRLSLQSKQGPARPEGFLEKFYASRDEGRGPIGTGI